MPPVAFTFCKSHGEESHMQDQELSSHTVRLIKKPPTSQPDRTIAAAFFFLSVRLNPTFFVPELRSATTRSSRYHSQSETLTFPRSPSRFNGSSFSPPGESQVRCTISKASSVAEDSYRLITQKCVRSSWNHKNKKQVAAITQAGRQGHNCD